MLIAFVLTILRIPECHATLSVEDGVLEFDSMPAIFGMPWLHNVEYQAHLQFFDDRPFLCQDTSDVLSLPMLDDDNSDDSTEQHASDGENDLGDGRMLNDDLIDNDDIHDVDGHGDDIDATTPVLENLSHGETKSTKPHGVADDLPVAMLVSRGACSFEEKAREALLLPNVKFCVIYDDRSRTHLVPMSASESNDLDVGMIFVSYNTGIRKLQD